MEIQKVQPTGPYILAGHSFGTLGSEPKKENDKRVLMVNKGSGEDEIIAYGRNGVANAQDKTRPLTTTMREGIISETYMTRLRLQRNR